MDRIYAPLRLSRWHTLPYWLAICCLLSAGAVMAADETRTRHGQYFGAMSTTYPAWFKESFLEFQDDIAEAAEHDKRVVVLFHQDGCPYCNALVERNLSQRDIESLLRQRFEVVALNMWGDREVVSVEGQRFTEKTFAAALQVQFTPTLLFFDERGQLALRLNGYLPPRAFKLALDYVAGKHESKLSYSDWVAQHDTTASTGELASAPYLDGQWPEPGARTRPLLAVFEQRDCPNCQTLHKRALSHPQTRELLQRFHTQRVDMWSSEPVTRPDGTRTAARQWATELGVSYAPSMVLFDSAGNEIIRTAAYFKRFHTQGVLDYVASGAYREEASFQRFLSAKAERLRAAGHDVNIWE